MSSSKAEPEDVASEGSLSRAELLEQLALERSRRLQTERLLADRERRMADVEAAASLGSWEWDTEADVIRWSERQLALHGLDADGQPATLNEFLERVRRGPDSPDTEVPILMLTAHTEMHRVLAARDAGVNWVVVKPISFKSLYDALAIIVESDRAFVRSEAYVGPDRRTQRRGGVAVERRKPRPENGPEKS